MQKIRCYENYHLNIVEYGVLSVILRLTCGGERNLEFNATHIASKFSGVAPEQIREVVDVLTEKGFLLPLTRIGCYRVLPHDEWVLRHGTDKCRTTPQTAGDRG